MTSNFRCGKAAFLPSKCRRSSELRGAEWAINTSVDDLILVNKLRKIMKGN